MPAMNWKQLISPHRVGSTEPVAITHDRSPFQRDFDRIVFSGALRRLQNKTQVFPLVKTDYVRTRLTHSLEASSIGRSLGTTTGVFICERFDTAGIHPSDVKGLTKESFAWLAELVNDDVYKQASGGKIVAVGEIGLDYYWDKDEKVRADQKTWFEWQMELARAVGLPVVIHSRDTAKDTLDMVKALRGGEIGGVVHCFSYPKEIAREYLNMGFFLGIGGVLTFMNARVLKEVAAYAPLDRIVLETDCPYLAPKPYRGKRNSSLYLPYVVKALAEIKGLPEETIIEKTWENGLKLYRMDG